MSLGSAAPPPWKKKNFIWGLMWDSQGLPYRNGNFLENKFYEVWRKIEECEGNMKKYWGNMREMRNMKRMWRNMKGICWKGRRTWKISELSPIYGPWDRPSSHAPPFPERHPVGHFFEKRKVYEVWGNEKILMKKCRGNPEKKNEENMEECERSMKKYERDMKTYARNINKSEENECVGNFEK